MSMNHVKIYYGPCDSFNTLAHKPQKLQGLIDRVQKLGFRVKLTPVEFVNYCVLEMCGHEVFRCNIQNLRFNSSYDLDPVCQRAITAVVESSAKFRRARHYLWFWTLIQDQILIRTEHGPKDYWPAELEMKSFEDCMNCVKCCGILTSKK